MVSIMGMVSGVLVYLLGLYLCDILIVIRYLCYHDGYGMRLALIMGKFTIKGGNDMKTKREKKGEWSRIDAGWLWNIRGIEPPMYEITLNGYHVAVVLVEGNLYKKILT